MAKQELFTRPTFSAEGLGNSGPEGMDDGGEILDSYSGFDFEDAFLELTMSLYQELKFLVSSTLL